MGIIGRRATADRAERTRVPAGFEALADSLLLDGEAVAAAHEIGRAAASRGALLDDVMADVEKTYQVAGLGEPAFEVVRSLALAWSEGSLQYLHAASCSDPLTGLSTLAHIRTRVAELYREASLTGRSVPLSQALLVIEIGPSAEPQLDRAMRLVDVVELARAVYPGEETIGRLGPSRVVVVVRRTDRLGDQVAMLRGLLADWHGSTGIRSRLWTERLPASMESADYLLDDLAR